MTIKMVKLTQKWKFWEKIILPKTTENEGKSRISPKKLSKMAVIWSNRPHTIFLKYLLKNGWNEVNK